MTDNKKISIIVNLDKENKEDEFFIFLFNSYFLFIILKASAFAEAF